MKKTILTLLILTLLLFAACSDEQEQDEIIIINETPEEPPELPDYNDEAQEQTTDETHEIDHLEMFYEENTVRYEALINKPTPCHEIEHEARINAENTIEVLVTLISSDDFCAQVIAPELITGEITAQQEPDDIIVIIQ